MNPLLCVIPYCKKDYELAKKLLEWIAELNGCRQHSCLLAADSEVDKEQRKALKELATKSFHSVSSIPLTVPTIGYAPNHMFMLTAQQIMFSYKFPFLWLEPDATPRCPRWLNMLSEEYTASPKKAMGSLIESKQPNLPAIHLAGVAIYPPDIFQVYDTFASIKNAIVAWDMEAATAMVPRAKNSLQMQHFWGKRDLPPTFVAKKEPGVSYPENTLDLSFLRPEAVLFHRCKDGTLIDCLRKAVPATPPPEVPRKRGRPRKIEPAFPHND